MTQDRQQADEQQPAERHGALHGPGAGVGGRRSQETVRGRAQDHGVAAGPQETLRSAAAPLICAHQAPPARRAPAGGLHPAGHADGWLHPAPRSEPHGASLSGAGQKSTQAQELQTGERVTWGGRCLQPYLG